MSKKYCLEPHNPFQCTRFPTAKFYSTWGSLEIGQVLPTTLEALKGLPHTKGYGFIKSSLVETEISNIPGNKGLLFVEGTGTRQRGDCYCWPFFGSYSKELVPGLGSKRVEKTKRVAEGVWASLSDTNDGREEGAVVEIGKWSSLATLDTIGYESRVIKSPSTSSSGYSEEKPGSELADAFKQQARSI
ncbi:hypothetical protein B9Z19DRAFT_1060435 [Tuber borchii]|uniref:Uncharacterized protein n=1 Tax=Tuber borchii TaxID=42251 RepID=A0A2T7A8X8_TUBBO|nr:hypothetical protein B9Z19DRAFT_1060435 [Tuber borchii]